MKLKISRRWRGAHALLRIASRSVLLLLAIASATSRTAAGEVAVLIHERVSPPDRAAEIGCFGTSPESPDGRKIAYVVYDRKPGAESGGFAPGSLYLCNADLSDPVKIKDIARVNWHDGALQLWLDNDTLAYMDYLPGKGYETYLIRKNGELVRGPLEAGLGHGETPDGSVLLLVDKRNCPEGSRLGRNGIYLYKGGGVTQVVDLEKHLGPLKDRLKGSDVPDEWSLFHAEFSTHGTYISIRLDTGKDLEHIVTCRADGTDVRLFASATKPLHQQWYDDSTLFAHERGSTPVGGGPRLQAKRWDRDGKYIETLAGPGNHMGISPDRKYLASESHYQIDPVVMKLYRTGNVEPRGILMNEAAGPVWKMHTHVNPAFSRDGRKVYFNKPVAGMPQVYRVDISRLVSARD